MEASASRKKVLVLLSQTKSFEAVRAVFERLGYEVEDEPVRTRDVAFTFLDPFFLNAGAVGFFKDEAPDMPLVLMASSGEIAALSHETIRQLYETLPMDGLTQECAEALVLDWLLGSEAQYLFQNSPLEFGSGLWVSLIRSMHPDEKTAWEAICA